MEKLNHWVEDWLFGRAEAEGTRINYLRCIKQINKFFKKRGKDLYDIVDEYRAARRLGYDSELDFTESWQDLIRAYSTFIKQSRYAPLTQKNYLSIAKSFFSYYKIPIDVDLPRRACVIYHNRDLSRENIRKIFNKASQRDRTIWLLMAESGLRVNTTIYLKYWQIKEDFEKEIVPMRIITPAESLKDHVGDRWSFIGEDGFKALKEYLQPRIPLNDDEFVFTTKKPERMKGDQFTSASLSTIWRKVVRALKLEKNSTHRKFNHFRMHGLRKYFRNNMRADPSYREFWMGHSLGVDAHYVSRDPEFHRKEYKKGYESLRILEPATPAQLTEIVDQLKQKDQEIQQLKKDMNEVIKNTAVLQELVDSLAEYGHLKGSTPLEIVTILVRMLAKKAEVEEAQKENGKE